MPLPSQLLEVPFATGLQQKTDPRLLPPGSATSLINAVIDKQGTIRKRPGVEVLGSTSVSALGNQVSSATDVFRQRAFRNVTGGLALLASGRVWAEAPPKSAWVDLDESRPIHATRYGIATQGVAVTSYDVATDDTYAIVVYCVGGSPWLTLFDLATSAVVYGPILIDNALGDEVRVNVCNSKAMVSYQSSAAVATIRCKVFDLAAWTLSASVAIVANCGFRGLFDVHTMAGAANTWAIAYITNSGANAGNVSVKLVDSAATVTATQVYAGTTGGGGFAQGRGITLHATSGEQIWVANAYDDGGNTRVRCRGLNPATLATTTADAEVWNEVATQYYRLGIERETSTRCVVTGALYTGPQAYWASRFSTAGASGLYAPLYGYGIASKPFTLNGRILANVVFEGDTTKTIATTYQTVDVLFGEAAALASYMPPRPVATIAPRVTTPGTSGMFQVSSAAVTGGTKALIVGSSERSASGGTGVDLIVVELPYTAQQVAQLGDVAYIGGGVPQAFDGTAAIESGFLHNVYSGSATAVAGGALAVGTYFYAIVYEYRDDKGQRIQSSPYFTSGTTAGANLTLRLVISALHLTQRQNTARSRTVAVAVYRTTVGAGASGVYYRVYRGTVPTAAQSDSRTLTLTYDDTVADASITSNERLNTAALAPASPSSLSCLIAHNGRLAGIGDDGVSIWLSTKFDGGTNTPYFSDSLVQFMPDGGRLTALASMDGQLVCFRRDAIYIIAGDGPDANGQQGEFAEPRRVATDSGCTGDWRGILVTPMGTLYQNGTYILALTRGLEVQYISAPVEDVLAQFPVITSAVLHSARDEVRFTVKAGETNTEGRVINWNYVTGCWSVFDYWDIAGTGAHAPFESSVVINGLWVGVTRRGNVYRETNDLSADAFTDASHWITAEVTTAWVRPTGVQGFFRAREGILAFESLDPTALKVDVFYDDSDTATETLSWTSAQIAAFTTPKDQVSLRWARQKCMSLRVRIYDAPDGSSTGQGFVLYGLAMEIAGKTGANRLPEVQQ